MADPELLAAPLRYFQQVAEHGSFTAAARALRVSQPSLSVAVRKLEEALGTALWDALVSETASITVMEVTALAVDLWLSASASFSDPLFWSSLIISLSAGLAAAYPVNVILVRTGIKEGMHDPRQMAGGHSHSTGAAG